MRTVPSAYLEVVTERGMRVRSRFETGPSGVVMERIIMDCPSMRLAEPDKVFTDRDSAQEFRIFNERRT